MMIGVEPTEGSSNMEMLAWDINNVLLNNGAPMLGVEPSPAASNFEMLLWDILQNSGGGGGPGTQVQSDWAQTNNTQVNFIKNKPSIPAAQVQADWNQTNPASIDFIKNKPGVYSDTYANWALAIENSQLPVGYYINITDADNCDLGLVLFCPKANQVSIQGVGLFLNADYQKIGDYSGVFGVTGIAAGTKHGVWIKEEQFDYSDGDILIWKNQHYQLIDQGELDSNPPDVNNLAFTLLPRNIDNLGYIEAADSVEYDFPNNYIQKRKDLLGNEISISYDMYLFFEDPFELKPIFQFTWGNSRAISNYANESYLGNYTFAGLFNRNYAIQGSRMIGITSGSSTKIEDNRLYGFSSVTRISILDGSIFSNNVLDNDTVDYRRPSPFTFNTVLQEINEETEVDLSGLTKNLKVVFFSLTTSQSLEKVTGDIQNLTIDVTGDLSLEIIGTPVVDEEPDTFSLLTSSYIINGKSKPKATFSKGIASTSLPVYYIQNENTYL